MMRSTGPIRTATETKTRVVVSPVLERTRARREIGA